jgi:hypothetical protein
MAYVGKVDELLLPRTSCLTYGYIRVVDVLDCQISSLFNII